MCVDPNEVNELTAAHVAGAAQHSTWPLFRRRTGSPLIPPRGSNGVLLPPRGHRGGRADPRPRAFRARSSGHRQAVPRRRPRARARLGRCPSHAHRHDTGLDHESAAAPLPAPRCPSARNCSSPAPAPRSPDRVLLRPPRSWARPLGPVRWAEPACYFEDQRSKLNTSVALVVRPVSTYSGARCSAYRARRHRGA